MLDSFIVVVYELMNLGEIWIMLHTTFFFEPTYYDAVFMWVYICNTNGLCTFVSSRRLLLVITPGNTLVRYFQLRLRSWQGIVQAGKVEHGS